jgi:hypothetical protein
MFYNEHVCVCMYVCVCVCVYMCMCVYICVCVSMCMYVCMCMWVCIYMCVCVCACARALVCPHTSWCRSRNSLPLQYQISRLLFHDFRAENAYVFVIWSDIGIIRNRWKGHMHSVSVGLVDHSAAISNWSTVCNFRTDDSQWFNPSQHLSFLC